MSRWAAGADQVAAMIIAGELEQVTPSQENAARLLAEDGRHLRSATVLAGEDPAGAYVIAILTDGSYEGWQAMHRVAQSVQQTLAN